MDLGGRDFELKFRFKCVWSFSGNLYGRFMEKIGLKAPGNYSASSWTNNFSILLLENPQSPIFMISGFLALAGTLVYRFNIPRYLILIIYNRTIH